MAPVKSALRALEILEFFAASNGPANVMQVAVSLGYPQSSTSMLLTTLEQQGYLHFDRDKRVYAPTVRVMLMSAPMRMHAFGAELLRVIERLNTSLRQTVVLGIRQGVQVRQLYSVQGDNPNPAHLPDGTLRPLCLTAMGKALLAALEEDEAARLVRAANATATRASEKVSAVALMEELREVRASGWASSVDYPAPDRATLAVVLPRIPGHPDMAMSLGMRKSVFRSRQQDFLAALASATKGLAASARKL
jgi:DNA-binding IclR family transcriptional regulator